MAGPKGKNEKGRQAFVMGTFETKVPQTPGRERFGDASKFGLTRRAPRGRRIIKARFLWAEMSVKVCSNTPSSKGSADPTSMVQHAELQGVGGWKGLFQHAELQGVGGSQRHVITRRAPRGRRILNQILLKGVDATPRREKSRIFTRGAGEMTFRTFQFGLGRAEKMIAV